MSMTKFTIYIFLLLILCGYQFVSAESALTIERDLNPEHQHLSYQGIVVENHGHQAQLLKDFVATVQNKKLYSAIEQCDLDSNCDHAYETTCRSNIVLAPQERCELWLHAYFDKSLSQPVQGNVEILLETAGPHSDIINKSFIINYSQNLYAGGRFESPGHHVAVWDGVKWSKLSDGLEGGDVLSLVEYKGDLYAAGTFYESGKKEMNYIAKWNGEQWENLNSGVGDGEAASVVVFKNGLYVGGGFDAAGDVPANYIAEWKGNTWNGFEFGFDGPMNTLFADPGTDTLYAGGEFDQVLGEHASYIAMMKRDVWLPLADGLSGPVYALTTDIDDTLYVGGLFDHAGNVMTAHIAQWKNNHWYGVGEGMNAAVLTLIADHNILYAGGRFTQAGYISANYIAQWNQKNWQPLSGGLVYSAHPNFTQVAALTIHADTLYAGGYFTQADNKNTSISVNYIAAWDMVKQEWCALGSGVDGSVSALAVVPSINLS